MSKAALLADCKRFVGDWVLFIDCSRAYDDAKEGDGDNQGCHFQPSFIDFETRSTDTSA